MTSTYAGTVQFFNRRRGYGFIQPKWTVSPGPGGEDEQDQGVLLAPIEGEESLDDVFVHITEIDNQIEPQYNCLVTGEIVVYTKTIDQSSGKVSATGVRGLLGTPLMCTRGSYRFRTRPPVPPRSPSPVSVMSFPQSDSNVEEEETPMVWGE